MNRSLRRAGAAVAATLLMLVAPGMANPAHAAAGTISGKLVAADGTPVEGAGVQLYRSPDIDYVGGTVTRADGTYTLPPAAAGEYWVEFSPPERPSQWAHGKPDVWNADVITVTDGRNTVVNETLLGVGEISGTVRYANGDPAFGVNVAANGDASVFGGFAQTDESGNYRMITFADTYEVSYSLPDNPGATVYAPGTLSNEDAGRYPVTVGSTTGINVTLPAIGAVSGRFTNEQGAPVAGADVSVNGVGHMASGWTTTDANGEYRISPVFAAAYQVQFAINDWTRVQYAYGKNRAEDADTIQVTGGADTVVNDSLLGAGSVRVRATDASTGAPVSGICGVHGPAQQNEEVCTSGSELILTGYPAGVNSFFLSSSTGLYFPEEVVFTAVTGQRVDVTVALRPAAAVSTRVVDAQTGAPVADACVHLSTSDRLIIGEGNTNCTGPDGIVQVDSLRPGTYKAFVRPPNTGGYGAQWVGASGGTGDFQAARVVTAQALTTTPIPTIRLDRAGTITGTVKDFAGQPVTDGLVALTAFHPGSGPSMDFPINSQGRYTVTGLGPYAWPLLFQSAGAAPQWSGGTANRNQATRIQVTAGASATHNMVLQPATRISGTLAASGTPASGWVVAYNTETGEPIGSGWSDNGRYEIRVLRGQSVKIGYDGYTASEDSFDGWYDDAASFATAKSLTITKAPVTIAITHEGTPAG